AAPRAHDVGMGGRDLRRPGAALRSLPRDDRGQGRLGAARAQYSTHATMRRTLRSLLLPVILLPVGWPHHLVLGLTNSPGDAHTLRSHAHVDARYQYLSGGV